ncbi:Fic family protein [Cyanobacterium stanieri LEGE 03274]|uniref:Fic family protein n=1 Tax=Cyanobacterium stanieri LEGE 03274 TaxID=1828756 RepID=A0ABR9V6G1_9CHRO|nr:Fic family protein [Cyanobacterium stanieri]MBE9223484.1 Fic family protein [Cyanobacterium stanieri LEGE 03274]
MNQSNCDSIHKRKKLLDELGKLPEAIVENQEWLYMLEEDTRHSLSIEGYFATEEELKAVLQGKKTQPEILNYYRTSQFVYDLGLQYHREESVFLDLALIRTIHSQLLRGIDQYSYYCGKFRVNAITIHGAKVKPPEFEIESYVKIFCKYTKSCLKTYPILEALSRIHTLFESIHPFQDGNGRVGRILLNYLAISQGYPPIVIKGVELSQRNQYYQALESADIGFHQKFSSPNLSDIKTQIDIGDFNLLKELLYLGLKPRLEHMIISALESKESLLPLKDLAIHFQVKETTLRQWIKRDKLIAIKKHNKLYSHPKLYLDYT